MNRINLYSLEYYVSLGCLNCCVGCSHGAPIRQGSIDSVIFKRDILKIKEIVRVKKFFLSGGEPLLNPEIEELIDIAKFSGLSTDVVVLTNGLLLDKQPESFWKKLDILRISRYPNQLTDEKVEEYRLHAKSYGVGFECLNISKFYKPFVRKQRYQEDVIDIFERCGYFQKCSAIYNGWYYPCPQASFFPEIMKLNSCTDGLELEKLTIERLQQFINQKFPLVSCQKCAYTQEFAWKQTTKDRWIEDSTEDEV